MKKVRLTPKKVQGMNAFALNGIRGADLGTAARTSSGLWQIWVKGHVVAKNQTLKHALAAADLIQVP